MRRGAVAVGLSSLLVASRALAQLDAPPPEPPVAPPPPPAPPPVAPPVAPPPVGAPEAPPPRPVVPTADRDPLAAAGSAAPVTAAGSLAPREWPVRPGLEIFAEYKYTRTYGAAPGASGWFHAFEVPRAHVSVDGELGQARARVVLEAVRSTAEGSLVGVATDSLVLRLREAYAAYRPLEFADVRAGVVQKLTTTELDGTWMLRAASPSAIEAAGLSTPADLGVVGRVDAPHRFGYFAVGAYDGEGYASRELNRGKNVEVAALARPLAGMSVTPLAVFATYELGSVGVARARADRFTAAALWQGERVRGGASFTYAWGVGPVGAQRGWVADAFVRVEPLPRLLVGARASRFVRDTEAEAADAVGLLTGSVGFRVAAPLEIHLVGDRSLPTSRAAAALPQADFFDARVVTRAYF